MVSVRSNPANPSVEVGDYFIKAKEAEDMVKGPKPSRYQEMEAFNFSNKARAKACKALDKFGIDSPWYVKRMKPPELDNRFLAGKSDEEVLRYVRNHIKESQNYVKECLRRTASYTAKQAKNLEAALKNAIKRGDTKEIIRVKIQLNNLRSSLRETAKAMKKPYHHGTRLRPE